MRKGEIYLTIAVAFFCAFVYRVAFSQDVVSDYQVQIRSCKYEIGQRNSEFMDWGCVIPPTVGTGAGADDMARSCQQQTQGPDTHALWANSLVLWPVECICEWDSWDSSPRQWDDPTCQPACAEDPSIPNDDPQCTGELLNVYTVSWTNPTHNIDGSPLTDLAGVRIYAFETRALLLDEPTTLPGAAVGVMFTKPSSEGWWCMVAVAYNSSGEESDDSNIACPPALGGTTSNVGVVPAP